VLSKKVKADERIQKIGNSNRVVAFCGTRGIPANYGGFETTVDEISWRFVKRGYNCVVFCRRSASDQMLESHKGRKLAYIRGSSVRALDTILSSLQTGWYLLRHRKEYSYVFWVNNANLPGILLTLLARIPMSVNTDGLEWRRAKWRWPFKAYYFLSSFLVARLCRSLISDAKAIQSYYKKVFLKNTQFIPYGVPDIPDVSTEKESAILERYGVVAGQYFLQITRFEPDNLPLEVARAFQATGLAKERFKLLLIGYKPEVPYGQQVKEMSGRDGIVVANPVYDTEVTSVLRSNCFCYVHGNTVGGTNPALLEALVSCPRVLAIDVPFNREVLGDTGYFFTPDRMANSLREVLYYPDQSAAMKNRARLHYDWEAVVESYVRLMEGQLGAYPLAGEFL
jgi:glycosyltransferase involved in cell wall biosynthesis